MQKETLTFTITDPITNEKIDIKTNYFLLELENMGEAVLDYLSFFEEDDQEYILKMIKLNMIFNADLIKNPQVIDLEEMYCRGCITETDLFNSGTSRPSEPANDLIRKAIFNQLPIPIPIGEEEYIDFRATVLAEMEDIDVELDEIGKASYKNALNKLNIFSRLKFQIFKKEEMSDVIDDAKCDIYKMIILEAHKFESHLESQGFSQRAEMLFEEFNEEDYCSLIDDVINFFKTHKNGNTNYSEIIKHLLEYRGKTDREDQLGCVYWIINHTVSRENAFKFILFEAEDIYLDFLDWFFREQYRQLRYEMTKEEKRIFQLLHFRREVFDYRIPVLEPLFIDFILKYNHYVTALIILVLGHKRREMYGKNIADELELRWLQYLEKYPELNQRALEYHLLSKESVINHANRLFTDQEAELLRLYMEGNSIELIAVKFDLGKDKVVDLIEELTLKLKNEAS